MIEGFFRLRMPENISYRQSSDSTGVRTFGGDGEVSVTGAGPVGFSRILLR